MANLKETATWEAGIYQFETSDPVMGGENGIDNKPTQQLANRTSWLKTELAKAVQSIGTNLQTAEQKYALKTTTLTAGAGLVGGGVLRDNMTLSLGTPSKITATTTNSAVSNTHTHEIDKASVTVMGIVTLSSATNSDAENLAATPKAIKTVDERSFKQYGALSSRNLNDLKGDANYGVWHQTANAAATAERNYPTTKAGTLYVLPSAYQGQQIYYPLDQNVFYKRHSLPDGSWSVWHTMSEVIDSPSSTSTTGAASANQVKRLNDRAANIEQTKLGNSGNQTIDGQLGINRNAWEKLRFTNADGSFWRFESAPVSESENGACFNYVFTGANGLEVGRVTFPRVAGGETVAYQTWVNSKIKFSRPVVKSSNVAVNLDLTQRAQIIAELGNEFVGNGVNQLVIHNTGTQHNVTNLPLPNKSPIQLDICLMGAYSYIDCHYITLNRSFRTPVNWNNETLTLNWKENLTQDNGVMLTGNQTIAGTKTFSARTDFANGIRFSAANKDGWADLGVGTSDIYMRNPISNKVLQLKDDGTLAYSNDKILLYSDRSNAVNLDSDAKIATSKAVKITYDKAVAAENSAAQSAPSGMIAYFARNAAPAGWLKANGAAVSRTTYAALFAAIGTTFGTGDDSTTFNLPDLRGEFLRGWDDGRGVDVGRAFGSHQSDAFQGHARNLKRSQSDARMHGLNYYQNVGTNNNQDSPAPAAINNGDTWLTHDYLPHLSYGTPRVAAETRPRNIALLACIKI